MSRDGYCSPGGKLTPKTVGTKKGQANWSSPNLTKSKNDRIRRPHVHRGELERDRNPTGTEFMINRVIDDTSSEESNDEYCYVSFEDISSSQTHTSGNKHAAEHHHTSTSQLNQDLFAYIENKPGVQVAEDVCLKGGRVFDKQAQRRASRDMGMGELKRRENTITSRLQVELDSWSEIHNKVNMALRETRSCRDSLCFDRVELKKMREKATQMTQEVTSLKQRMSSLTHSWDFLDDVIRKTKETEKRMTLSNTRGEMSLVKQYRKHNPRSTRV